MTSPKTNYCVLKNILVGPAHPFVFIMREWKRALEDPNNIPKLEAVLNKSNIVLENTYYEGDAGYVSYHDHNIDKIFSMDKAIDQCIETLDPADIEKLPYPKDTRYVIHSMLTHHNIYGLTGYSGQRKFTIDSGPFANYIIKLTMHLSIGFMVFPFPYYRWKVTLCKPSVWSRIFG